MTESAYGSGNLRTHDGRVPDQHGPRIAGHRRNRKILAPIVLGGGSSLLLDSTQHGAMQIGFARVVTDYTDFAWLCDIFIDETHRGKGLGKFLMESALAHPDLQGLRRVVLATRDAHELYAKYGFRVLRYPERWMEREV